MSVSFVLKSIWIFILGVVVAIIGLYCLVFRPELGSNSFTIMLIGLFFTGAGSIYGKRKLGEGEPAVSTPPQQKPWEYPSRPSQPQQPQEVPESYPGYPPREVPARRMETPAKPKEPPTEQFLEIAEESMKPETEIQKTLEPAPSEPDVEFGKPEIPAKPMAKPKEARIIKIVVCPNCGTENETKDRFCYNCGKKLKPEKKKVMKPKKIILPAKLLAKPTIKKPVQPAVKTLPKAIELPARKKIVKKVKKKPIEGNL